MSEGLPRRSANNAEKRASTPGGLGEHPVVTKLREDIVRAEELVRKREGELAEARKKYSAEEFEELRLTGDTRAQHVLDAVDDAEFALGELRKNLEEFEKRLREDGAES